MGIDTPKVSENTEIIASVEKFTNLQKAIGDYNEERVVELSEKILEKFTSGKFKVYDPAGNTHSGVVFRNFCFAFASPSVDAPKEGDELNYTLWGIAIKKTMDINPDFNKFVREYILNAQEADNKAWTQKEDYSREHSLSGHVMTDNQDDDVYTQGKIMAKFILGEI